MAFRSLISKIEIERKFLPTRPILHALTRTTTIPISPSISRARPAAVHFIRDVYYDRHDGRLTAEGLWVRRRSVVGGGSSSSSCIWEAKVRVGGDFVASQFVVAIDQVVETTGGDFVAACVALERMSVERDRGGDSNLTSPIYRSPDLFFHEIGELELMEEVRTEAAALGENGAEQGAQEHEMRRKSVAGARAAQLEVFMRAHPALFPMTPRPRGKLVAYFAWREERAAGVR
ncbi:hypothetical protein C8F04DRAFT_1402624 [Mycena alexandri]|uniref:CYTH domain-containing protein n=1 Tax=Mycena alexandri TaxID=1745969 RepID=A0AAD6WR35_9AGAR|nr:hypothetical protein C8F04DRAFT_1402624 [Mycena alexandri]